MWGSKILRQKGINTQIFTKLRVNTQNLGILEEILAK